MNQLTMRHLHCLQIEQIGEEARLQFHEVVVIENDVAHFGQVPECACGKEGGNTIIGKRS